MHVTAPTDANPVDGGAGAHPVDGDSAAFPRTDAAPSERAADITTTTVPPPPSSWKEHWFEHDQLLTMVSDDEHAVVYLDDAVGRDGAAWLFPFLSRLWAYTKTTYGVPGDARLYAVFHEGRYLGGHASSVFDASHDFKNVIDYGGAVGIWQDMGFAEGPTITAGMVLEGASLGIEHVPSASLTGLEFPRIYAYDALTALGFAEAATRLLARANEATTNSPRPNTYWFRDWFHPLWKRGGAALFARYFQLLSRHYPQVPRADGRGFRYAPEMNSSEYVHFMSGAAGVDLKPLATAAFGWTPDQEIRFKRAKADFPAIAY